MTSRILPSVSVLLCLWSVAASAAAPANSIDILDKSRPRSLEQLQQAPESSKTILSAPQPIAQHDEDDLDRKLAVLLHADDCQAIVNSVSSRDYESVKPEVLAVVAYCEPAGKDPAKMFAFAEQRAPDSDIVLLLHARYLWKRKNPDSENLFQKLYSRTQDQRIKELAGQYLVGQAPVTINRSADGISFLVAGQIGGIQEANPEGLAVSDQNFGNNNSSAAVAQVAASLRKPLGTYSVAADYIVSDTTYWATHDADLLTQDLDLTLDKNIGSNRTVGLRPFTSFYLLQGARYYSLQGIGLTTSHSSESIDNWAQLSRYVDTYYASQSSAQSGGHVRLDWQGTLKKVPLLAPTLLGYIDYAKSGVDLTGGSYIPYSHTEFGAAVSFTKVVHKYSVGLTMRGVYREDAQTTRITDPSGNYVSKTRRDVQVVLQPHITVPLIEGADLFMYFESNSISSTLTASDGLDRNISNNLIGAVVRFSVANF